MARKHKRTFIPKAGEEIPRGVPTEVVTPRHRHVEYLSPRKTAVFKHFEAMPPPPPELTALAPSTATAHSALDGDSFPPTEPDDMDVVPELEVPLDSDEDSEGRPTAKANNTILWQAGWWPGTFKRTRTVFTYHVLKLYDRLTLQAKTSAQDFIATLRRLTNHAFPREVKDRYREFMTSHREFQHLQTLRRFGLDVADKLPEGSVAVLCPACPQLSINMDLDWETRPQTEWYKDALFFAKDGNFVLSQHDKKFDPKDVSLFDGAAYFPDNAEYQDFLKGSKDDADLDCETETCSEFKAGKTRYTGKAISGVITLCCARHGFALPCGTVDMTEGEKYKHVDWATTHSVKFWRYLKRVYSSYDINCIYGNNWPKRLAKMTGVDKIWPHIVRCVPKWHLNAHTGICRWLNSFYFTPGSGQTDGEEPERRWSILNSIGRIVREMTGGHRQDILNMHYSDYNIQKMFGLALQLKKKLDDAIKSSALNNSQLEGLEETARLKRMPLNEWKAEEDRFARHIMDPLVTKKSMKNPYEPLPDNEPTLKDINDKWDYKPPAVQKAKKRRTRADVETEESTSVISTLGSLFLSVIDIERDQRLLKALIANQGSLDAIQDARDDIEHQINEWFQQHNILLGTTINELKTELTSIPAASWPVRGDGTPEDVALPVPSTYPLTARNHPRFAMAVAAERDIRRAQASDALRELRYKLGLKSFLFNSTAGAFGQVNKTRNQKTMHKTNEDIRQYREEYELARSRLYLIAEPTDKAEYPPLTADDCVQLNLYHAQEKPGMKRKEVSWIWRDKRYQGEKANQYTSEAARIEWFRASARRTRWAEELELVKEERVQVSHRVGLGQRKVQQPMLH
ncbi:hypothetical protein TRAPUB_10785, partial [Trametes pubescens]